MNYQLHQMDCLEYMRNQPDNIIDLTITSPPYDNLRDYKEYSFDYYKTLEQLYRITKPGGTVVWIVNDATINGSKTGTSFRQALAAIDIGFKLNDTMIWKKPGFSYAGGLNVRYGQVFEYMFIFTKGKPKTFNALRDRKNKHVGIMPKTKRLPDGTVLRLNKKFTQNEYGIRFNVWEQSVQTQRGDNRHPAPFPLQLIKDHILSWSNPGDLVFDPFTGSGTTALASKELDRNFVGTEISQEYINIANKRLANTYNNLFEEII
jgi:site-specific DNA-methyltransferase (adenine-specific)